jgi:thiol-disulfide isomerase/thioredoxin
MKRFLGLLFLFAAPAFAAGLPDANAVPHMSEQGRVGYRQFLASTPHRAFAIAPGGAWGWVADAESPEAATEQALATCQGQGRQTCVAYAVDNTLAFDRARWVTLWGPYLRAAGAAAAPTGMLRGQRLPDLAFATADGKPVKLSDFRGKVTVLHFWGSWCPPCQREMPDLARLVKRMEKNRDVLFVLLQVREDFASASAWAKSHGAGLPLYDSGTKNSSDDSLRLMDGGRLKDRELAKAFPSTYVLDKHGIVLFSHTGPVTGWEQYAPFLEDAVAQSGR